MFILDQLLVSALFSSSISVICISAKSHIGATLLITSCKWLNACEYCCVLIEITNYKITRLQVMTISCMCSWTDTAAADLLYQKCV